MTTASKPAAALLLQAGRAALLESQTPSAADALRFAAALFRAQAQVAEALWAAPLTGALDADAPALLEPARALLLSIAEAAPSPLAEAARERRAESADRFVARLQVYFCGDSGDYLSRAILQPYARTLAARALPPDRPRPEQGCPFCGGAPAIAARRPESDSTRRLLCCALCGGEWQVNRIHCPSCNEENPARLPHFQSDTHASARIEACETCHRYVKSIDLSVDGRLIPEVDDLCSIALDLWALEQGFSRIEPGLLGI